ncbi:MAG: MOSC domain-containing protein [Actinomycetota bacterium]
MAHLSTEQLVAGQGHVQASPADDGTLELLVARPDVDQRKVLEVGELVVGEGLAGDNYLARGDSKRPDGSANPEAQLNLMNARSVNLVANGEQDLWPLAGDQMFVDLDLSRSNLPTGTRLAIGSAVIEVTAKPHNGCAKFAQRFGMDAARWVNSDDEQRYRGINAAVVQAGTVRPGDTITKLPSS